MGCVVAFQAAKLAKSLEWASWKRFFGAAAAAPKKTTLNTKANYPLPDYSFSFQYFAKQANYRETEQ